MSPGGHTGARPEAASEEPLRQLLRGPPLQARCLRLRCLRLVWRLLLLLHARQQDSIRVSDNVGACSVYIHRYISDRSAKRFRKKLVFSEAQFTYNFLSSLGKRARSTPGWPAAAVQRRRRAAQPRWPWPRHTRRRPSAHSRSRQLARARGSKADMESTGSVEASQLVAEALGRQLGRAWVGQWRAAASRRRHCAPSGSARSASSDRGSARASSWCS